MIKYEVTDGRFTKNKDNEGKPIECEANNCEFTKYLVTDGGLFYLLDLKSLIANYWKAISLQTMWDVTPDVLQISSSFRFRSYYKHFNDLSGHSMTGECLKQDIFYFFG